MNSLLDDTSLELRKQENNAYEKKRLRMEQNRMDDIVSEALNDLDYVAKIRQYDFDIVTMYKSLAQTFDQYDSIECVNSFLESYIEDMKYG